MHKFIIPIYTIYGGFITLENDTAYLDMNNSIPADLKWYFHNFDE